MHQMENKNCEAQSPHSTEANKPLFVTNAHCSRRIVGNLFYACKTLELNSIHTDKKHDFKISEIHFQISPGIMLLDQASIQR